MSNNTNVDENIKLGSILDNGIVKRLSNGEHTYLIESVIGTGSFGIVYRAKCEKSNSIVAIKRVKQELGYQNRELQITKELNHCNIVALKDSFYIEEKETVYLYLVLEFVPETIYYSMKQYSKSHSKFPVTLCKLYIYQVCRGLAYLHHKGICHRDIKPQNLLLNRNTGNLKLCDLGSAKVLIHNKPNVSYICSRYYRAPELIFGSKNYTTAIDIWSTGCILAEMLVGKPIFKGENTADQLIEIIKILGTPTRDQIQSMNTRYKEFKFTPNVEPKSWNQVLGPSIPDDAVDLISKMLVYNPSERLKAIEVCAHPFFDELRSSNSEVNPELFEFSNEELEYIDGDLLLKLKPNQPSQ